MKVNLIKPDDAPLLEAFARISGEEVKSAGKYMSVTFSCSTVGVATHTYRSLLPFDEGSPQAELCSKLRHGAYSFRVFLDVSKPHSSDTLEKWKHLVETVRFTTLDSKSHGNWVAARHHAFVPNSTRPYQNWTDNAYCKYPIQPWLYQGGPLLRSLQSTR